MANDSGMQYIMDGTGNYYRLNSDDQLVVAGGREEATVFTVYEANQRIGIGKKSKFYQTIPAEAEVIHEGEERYVEDKIQIIEGSDMKKNNPSYEFEYNIAGIRWMDYLNLFCYLANSAKDYQIEMGAKQSAVEKEICDLLHYIELYDLSDDEAMNAVDMLKEARQRRRDIKDEIMCVDLFQKNIGTSTNVAKAKVCIKELRKLENRIYRPRELPELFTGMEKRKTERRKGEDFTKESGSDDAYEQKEAEVMEMRRQDTVFDGRQNNWQEFARQQLEFFSNIQQYMINLELDLDEIDRAIENILIEIEDAKYNVAQGYKAFKELKDLRNERKDKWRELDQLQVLAGCFDCSDMSQAYQYAVETIQQMEQPAAGNMEIIGASEAV